MHFGPAYNMEPPYIVLRRIGKYPITDVGDQEYFVGHHPRWFSAWRKPFPKWEPFHLPIHQGLYRFKTRDDAQAYMDLHKDMGAHIGELIEFVKVEVPGHVAEWKAEAPVG